MTTTTSFDQALEQIAQGEPLSLAALHEFAAGADILPLGMLADAWRARLHGARATFLRVALVPWDAIDDGVGKAPGARELRLTGAPDTFDVALATLQTAKSLAAGRTVSAFAWTDVTRWASALGEAPVRILVRLREGGLDDVAGLRIDDAPDVTPMIEALAEAGYSRLRLQVGLPAAADRLAAWVAVDAAHVRLGCVQAISPLPGSQRLARPTTGYDDVKMLASARLAAPHVPSVQVDWLQYGPKLAQVALTFGADDLDNVSGVEDTGEGRRRAPLEEIRRNIQAAGLEAVERDGRFAPIPG